MQRIIAFPVFPEKAVLQGAFFQFLSGAHCHYRVPGVRVHVAPRLITGRPAAYRSCHGRAVRTRIIRQPQACRCTAHMLAAGRK